MKDETLKDISNETRECLNKINEVAERLGSAAAEPIASGSGTGTGTNEGRKGKKTRLFTVGPIPEFETGMNADLIEEADQFVKDKVTVLLLTYFEFC